MKIYRTTPGIGYLDSRYVNVTGDTMSGNLTVPNLILSTGKLYPTADSTTALQFNKANGTTNVLNIDTTNARVVQFALLNCMAVVESTEG